MAQSAQFKNIIDKGGSVGEVVAMDRFIITIAGLSAAPVGSIIMFEDGSLAMVRELREKYIQALVLTKGSVGVGSTAVLKDNSFKIGTGSELLGRVINPLGKPMDNKGHIAVEEKRDIFFGAPGALDREPLKEQLPSGVTLVDTLFPIVKGQRIAVLGDSKTGKTTLLSRLAAQQKKTGRIVVYVLIGKREQELSLLLNRFENAGAMDNTVLVVADPFEPLPLLYLAPYVACAIAEHFWYGGKDVVIVYDDLSAHARAYREMSLLLKVNPGRESYPGDIFHLHSSLLERAGKLKKTGTTLTALPVLWTPNDNMTAYVPTNLISITDGHIFFDTKTYEEGKRPAIRVDISVSRIGARAKTKIQKNIMREVSKRLAAYREALQFSHFGADLATETRRDLVMGQQIYGVFNQDPEELFSIAEQQIALRAVLLNEGKTEINSAKLKNKARELAPQLKKDEDIEPLAKQLLAWAQTKS